MSTFCRIGLLQLADSAPVLVARSMGIFTRHGLDVEAVVVPSWANIADGLVWNGLDGALMFPPLAIMTALGQRGRAIGLRPGFPVSRGGNTIVLRGQKIDHTEWTAQADKHRAFDNWKNTLGRKPRLGVVHLYSTHYLILSRFLKNLSVCRDTETEIVIMPPARMIQALAAGEIDGFCAGPPWGAEAHLKGLAFIVAGSASLAPGHLEKMLVLKDVWKSQNPDAPARMHAALTEAIALCHDPAHAPDITHLLSRPLNANGLGLPEEAVKAVMPGSRAMADTMMFGGPNGQMGAACGWMIEDMQNEGWLPSPMLETLRTLGWYDC